MYQIHMKPKNGAQMPMCSFGEACTRKQCVYRHPPKTNKSKAITKSSTVCPAFLLGHCEFGARCRNTHVSEEEAEALRNTYAQTMCRFGSRCCTKNCLFFHPPPEPCQYGARCVNPYCMFSHPEEEEEQEERPAARPVVVSDALVFPKSKALLQREKEERLRAEYAGGASHKPAAALPTVKVPADAWVADYQRNAGVYLQYTDPVEKLLAVNERSPRGVIDLHFQKSSEVCNLFELTMAKALPELEWWEFYDKDERTVWVVTGSGNHTTHSRAYLFDVLLAHLQEHGYSFKIAVNNGAQGGFLIKL